MLHLANIFFAAILSALLASCGNINVELDKELSQDTQPFEFVSPKYEIGASDILGLTLYVNPVTSNAPYLIQIGDVLSLEFTHYPEYNRSLLVRPDGYITLPLAGEIMAAGMPPSELRLQIQEKIKDHISHPEVMVVMTQINTVVERFKQTMTTDNFGETRLINVRPDGYATVPLVGEVHFAGKTVPAATQEIKDEFIKMLGNVVVSLNVQTARSNLFYVMGWVKNPGFYKIVGPTTVMQGIALAGGFRDEAQRSDVVLVTRDKDKRPVGKIIDADNVIGIANIANDSFVKQYDIVYVQPTTMAKVSIFGRDLWTIIPLRFSVAYRIDDY